MTRELVDLINEMHRMAPSFVGLDNWATRMTPTITNTKYPPYNLIKTDENTYRVEIAVAGFKKEELTIEIVKGTLLVKGEKVVEETAPNFVYKGLSSRSFTRSFPLAEHIEVFGATLENGILGIDLKRINTDDDVKKIAIV